MVLILVVVIDEMSASTGPYRPTVLDRITGDVAVTEGRAEVSVQLAQSLCRQRVTREFGPDLLQVMFDNRSSRYNPEYKVHIVFLDLQINGESDADIYVRCIVSAVNRRIIEYRVQGWGNPFWD